jgi:uncharacterized protein YegP (UPF0339 family)
MTIFIEPFENEDGVPQFHLVHSNGQILATSEPYEGGPGHRDDAINHIAAGPIIVRLPDGSEWPASGLVSGLDWRVRQQQQHIRQEDTASGAPHDEPVEDGGMPHD